MAFFDFWPFLGPSLAFLAREVWNRPEKLFCGYFPCQWYIWTHIRGGPWGSKKSTPYLTPLTQAAATMRRNSFRAKAAFLFNALPDHLRNISLNTSMDKIKRDLDKLLQTVTDEPMLAGYTRSNDSPSNSLVHQLVRCRALDLWRPSSSRNIVSEI